MTKQKHARPTWWSLYTAVLIIIGALILAHRLAPSPGWRTFFDVGVVIVGYALITWWLETHPFSLLDGPMFEADNPAIKLPQLEPFSSLLPQVRCQFYVGSDPAIIYGWPERAMFQ